jgi:hypothetical protein
MSEPSFAARYRDGLSRFVDQPTEGQLTNAYELGRFAVQSGLSVLEVAAEHTRALASLAQKWDPAEFVEAIEPAGDFFVESLAAFEMVQRGVTEARRAALEERRRARMLRQLSSVLADATVVHTAAESIHELAQIIAEITREATGAAQARVVLRTALGMGNEVTATAEDLDADTWPQMLQRLEPPKQRSAGGRGQPDILTEQLRALDGSSVGELEVGTVAGARFDEDDRATVVHIGQMTAAWLERAQRRSP